MSLYLSRCGSTKKIFSSLVSLQISVCVVKYSVRWLSVCSHQGDDETFKILAPDWPRAPRSDCPFWAWAFILTSALSLFSLIRSDNFARFLARDFDSGFYSLTIRVGEKERKTRELLFAYTHTHYESEKKRKEKKLKKNCICTVWHFFFRFCWLIWGVDEC